MSNKSQSPRSIGLKDTVPSVAPVDSLDHAKSIISSLRAASKARRTMYDNNSTMPTSAQASDPQPSSSVPCTPRAGTGDVGFGMEIGMGMGMGGPGAGPGVGMGMGMGMGGRPGSGRPGSRQLSARSGCAPDGASVSGESPPQHQQCAAHPSGFVLQGVSDLDKLVAETAQQLRMDEDESRAVQQLIAGGGGGGGGGRGAGMVEYERMLSADANGDANGDEEEAGGLVPLTEEEQRQAIFEYMREQAEEKAEAAEMERRLAREPVPGRGETLVSRERGLAAMAAYEMDSEDEDDDERQRERVGSKPVPVPVPAPVAGRGGGPKPAAPPLVSALPISMGSTAPAGLTNARPDAHPGLLQTVSNPVVQRDISKYDAIMAKINAGNGGAGGGVAAGLAMTSNVLFTYSTPAPANISAPGPGKHSSKEDEDDDDEWINSDEEADAPPISALADSDIGSGSSYDEEGIVGSIRKSQAVVTAGVKSSASGVSVSGVGPQKRPLPVFGGAGTGAGFRVFSGQGQGQTFGQGEKQSSMRGAGAGKGRTKGGGSIGPVDDWDMDADDDDWDGGGGGGGNSFPLFGDDTVDISMGYDEDGDKTRGSGGRGGRGGGTDAGGSRGGMGKQASITSSINFKPKPKAKPTGNSNNSSGSGSGSGSGPGGGNRTGAGGSSKGSVNLSVLTSTSGKTRTGSGSNVGSATYTAAASHSHGAGAGAGASGGGGGGDLSRVIIKPGQAIRVKSNTHTKPKL